MPFVILETELRRKMILENSNPSNVNEMLDQYFKFNKNKVAKIVKKYEFESLEEAAWNLDLIMDYSSWKKFNFSVNDLDYSQIVDNVYLNLNAERKIKFQKGRGLRLQARRKTKGYCMHLSFLLASIGKHFGKKVHILNGKSEYLEKRIGKKIKSKHSMHGVIYCETDNVIIETLSPEFIKKQGGNPMNIKKEKITLDPESIEYLKKKNLYQKFRVD